MTVVGAAALGLLLGSVLDLAWAGTFVLPALVVMVTAVLVQVDGARVAEIRRARRVLVASLMLNFVAMPLLAWLLGAGLLGDEPDLRVGLLLLLVTPCTDWYLVFTAAARGHTGIATALLPVNLALQVLLLPVYVLLLGGDAAPPDLGGLLEAVVLVLVVPMVLAVLARLVVGRRGAATRDRVLVRPAARAVPVLLNVAVLALVAAQAPVVTANLPAVWRLLVPLAVFFVLAPAFATVVARAAGLPGDQRVTLVMTTTARNSPVALGIAVAAFPDRPLVAVALVVAPLVELPALALVAQVVRHRERA